MAAHSTRGRVVERYALALHELCADDPVAADGVAGDLALLRRQVDESPAFHRFLTSPVIPAAARHKTILAIARDLGFHPTTSRLLSVLAENRRLAIVADLAIAFARRRDQQTGSITVHVTSATALSAEQHTALEHALAPLVRPREESTTPSPRVTLTTTVDSSLLAGVTIQAGSRMIDASLRTRINAMALTMKGKL